MQKVMNDVLVRDFVKIHYQFSEKVMDPNFIRRVAKEIVNLNKFVNNFVVRLSPSWLSSHQILYINSLFIYLQLCIMTKVIFIYSNIKMYLVESLSLSSSKYKVSAYDVSNVHVKSYFSYTIYKVLKCLELQ